jgi:hypothetical protein
MKKALLPFLFFLFSIQGFAAIYGAHFEWEHLSQDTFRVDLIFYTNCDSTISLSSTELTISSNCTTRTQYYNSIKSEDITPVCKAQCISCDAGCTFKYGFTKHTLSTILVTTYERQNSCCELNLSFFECCRSKMFTTGAAGTSFYIDSKINICQGNLLPKVAFEQDPAFFHCIGRDVKFDFGLKDLSTNDSVVYTFHCPRTSTNNYPNFSNNQVCGVPYYLGFPKGNLKFPRGYHVDSFTGEIMFRPMKVEATNTGLKAEIYRKGRLVAVVKREFPLIIIKCPDNDPPVLSGINNTSPSSVHLKGDFCPNSKHCITINTSDNDHDDTVSLSLLRSNLPNATFTLLNSNTKRPSYRICFDADATMTGNTYEFELLAKDNNCPLPANNRRTYAITIDTPKTPSMIGRTQLHNCDTFTLSFLGRTETTFLPINWYVNEALKDSGAYFNFKLQDTGIYYVKAKINSCGVLDSFVDTLHLKKPNDLKIYGFNDTSVCALTQLRLKPTITGSVDSLSYDFSSQYYNFTTNRYEFYRSFSKLINIDLKNNREFKFWVKGSFVETTSNCKIEKTIAVMQDSSFNINLGNDFKICPNQDTTVVFEKLNGLGEWSGPHLQNDTFSTLGTKASGVFNYEFQYRNAGYCTVAKRSITKYIQREMFEDDTITTCVGDKRIELLPYYRGGNYYGSTIDTNVIFPTKDLAGENLVFYSVESNDCIYDDSILINIVDYQPNTGLLNEYAVCQSDSSFIIEPTTENGSWNGPGLLSDKNELTIDPRQLSASFLSYAYNLIDKNNCKASDTVVVEILERPSIDGFTVGHNKIVCAPDSFLVYSPTAFATWKIDDEYFYGSRRYLTYKGDKIGGSFQILLKAIDTTGCFTERNIRVFNRKKPVATFSIPDSVKQGESFVPRDVDTNRFINQFYWNIAQGINQSWYIDTPTITIDTVGTFTLFHRVIDTRSTCRDSISKSLVVYKPNSLSEIEHGVEIFPNPFKNTIQLKSDMEIELIRVYNANGQLILYNMPSQNQVSIDMENLTNGLYFLRIKTEDGYFSKRILKQ